MSSGSPANMGVPSGTANRSPVKRNPASISKNSGPVRSNCGRPRKYAISSLVKRKFKQIFDGLRQPRGENEVAVVGKTPHVQLEGCALAGLAGFEVARRHGELIEIGLKRVIKRCRQRYFFPPGLEVSSLTSAAAWRSPLTVSASS